MISLLRKIIKVPIVHLIVHPPTRLSFTQPFRLPLMIRKFVNSFALSTGILAILWVVPASSLAQATKNKDVTIETKSSVNKEGIATTDSSAKNLLIPTSELNLLVKPLTLEELDADANAWFNALKSKVHEITEAEINIKRQELSLIHI